jgi:aminoglycoside phosphotransferase family enzyme/predicted kinase
MSEFHAAVEGRSPGFAIGDMLDPAVYPHPVTHFIERETPISWVILTGQYAYKIKKPVRLEFIDASNLAARRDMCEGELVLNRRLAPELYLEVVAITRERGLLRVGGSGAAVEYAVKMREFEESAVLASLLEQGAVSTPEVTDLARRLAAFHAHLPVARAEGRFPGTEHLQTAVLGNLATLLSHLNELDGLAEMGPLIDWTHDALHELLPVLRRREQLGFVRDCHGDLHARNIVRWNAKLIPFDCLDFSRELRSIDVMNDVAFLFMDLAGHDRMDLAMAFLNRYLEATGDYDGLRPLAFYAVYRALVRAMVDSIDGGASQAARQAIHRKMCGRIATAARFARRAAPRLCLMHGPSGSGKSWLSERLAPPLEAVRIRSDIERKRLAGLAADTRTASAVERGIYGLESTHGTYARLLECAGASLEAGFTTIVDATFLRMEDRRPFEDFADAHRIPLVIVSCEADRALLAPRIKARQLAQNDSSEADLNVLEWQLGHEDPLDAREKARAVSVRTDTDNPAADALDALRRD